MLQVASVALSAVGAALAAANLGVSIWTLVEVRGLRADLFRNMDCITAQLQGQGDLLREIQQYMDDKLRASFKDRSQQIIGLMHLQKGTIGGAAHV